MATPNPTLFNCCPGFLPPDWQRFDGFEVSAVNEEDGLCETCEPHEATFWTVYGHCREGGVDAITDVSTERLAMQIAGLFEKELQS